VAQLHLFWLNLKTHFQTASGWIAKTATIGNFVALTWIVLSVVVFTLIVQDLMRDVVTIEPIEVPKALADSGYTAEVAGHRLRDALNVYADRATSLGDDGASSNLGAFVAEDANIPSNFDLNIAARDELPDVVVPQIGLSLGAIVSSIRSVLHTRGHAISGELTLRDRNYALRVRVDGRQVFSSLYESENPDDLMTKAAPWVMDVIRPSVNAMARYRVQKEEGLLKADEIIAHYDESDINVQWAYILKGNHALTNLNYGEAETMFSKAKSLKEQQYIQLGVTLLRQAKPEQAIEQFRRAIAINPKSAIAYNNIGVALATLAKRDKAKLDDAIAQYYQAIAAEPRYALPYNNLGLALLHLDRINDAIDNYRFAIQVAPKYLSARYNLAFALQRQRSFAAALTEYRDAIDFTTDTLQLAMLHTSLGDVHVLREQAGEIDSLEDAIAEYRSAIEIRSGYRWAHNNLGLIWRDQGKINDAIAEFRYATGVTNMDVANETEIEMMKVNLQQALQAKEAGATKATSVAKQ
jgi:tetratricopeptide (TPR) repeat protein